MWVGHCTVFALPFLFCLPSQRWGQCWHSCLLSPTAQALYIHTCMSVGINTSWIIANKHRCWSLCVLVCPQTLKQVCYFSVTFMFLFSHCFCCNVLEIADVEVERCIRLQHFLFKFLVTALLLNKSRYKFVELTLMVLLCKGPIRIFSFHLSETYH